MSSYKKAAAIFAVAAGTLVGGSQITKVAAQEPPMVGSAGEMTTEIVVGRNGVPTPIQVHACTFPNGYDQETKWKYQPFVACKNANTAYMHSLGVQRVTGGKNQRGNDALFNGQPLPHDVCASGRRWRHETPNSGARPSCGP